MQTPMATYNTPKPKVTMPTGALLGNGLTTGLMDSKFVYVPAADTDIRKTFARVQQSIDALAAATEDAGKRLANMAIARYVALK